MHPPLSCKVYTPSDLAEAMVTALGYRPDDTWLDPCCGDGVFCRAIRHVAGPSSDITAIDLDRGAAAKACASRIHAGIDFLKWSRVTENRYSKIILNPPYVAIRRLSSALRRSALCCDDVGNTRVTGHVNYWYVFMLQSIRLVEQGGSIAAVLPAAWDYADYARPLRSGIASQFEHVEVYRCAEPLFESVQEGSVVVVARGRSAIPATQHRFEYERRVRFIAALQTRVDLATETTFKTGVRGGDPRALVFRDLFNIRIGAVCGDAQFFVLSEERRVALRLPRTSVRPLLSRATHAALAEVKKSTWIKFLKAGERVWLFYPTAGGGSRGPVRRYMLRKESNGGCRRSAYKVRNRDPWYRVVLPPRADGFLSGMAACGPHIAWNEMRSLTATNTLYLIQCRTPAVRKSRFAWGLSMLTTFVKNQLASKARVYADGLTKFEPSDFASLRLPVPPKATGARRMYRSAISLINMGRSEEATLLADEWFGLEPKPAVRYSDASTSTVCA
jgi:adenine-specific DNA-methyltransferase